MILYKIAAFINMMIVGNIDATAFVIDIGRAKITVMITIADDDSADLLLAVRGILHGTDVTRFYAFHLTKPYQSIWVEPADYKSMAELLQPDHMVKSGGSEDSKWEPFNIFAFIERNLPCCPLGGAEGREAVEAAKNLMRANVEESDKIYFHSLRANRNGTHVTARNLAKTLAMAGDAAYRYCSDHNVSICWTSYPELARDIDTAINYINGN